MLMCLIVGFAKVTIGVWESNMERFGHKNNCVVIICNAIYTVCQDAFF